MGINVGRAAGGAASGAAMGSAIMPGWGTAIGGLVGGGASILGDLFGGNSEDEAKEAEAAAAAQKLQAMREASAKIGAYRPINAQGRMNAMGDQIGVYGGAMSQLQKMYGPSVGGLPTPDNPFTRGGPGGPPQGLPPNSYRPLTPPESQWSAQTGRDAALVGMPKYNPSALPALTGRNAAIAGNHGAPPPYAPPVSQRPSAGMGAGATAAPEDRTEMLRRLMR